MFGAKIYRTITVYLSDQSNQTLKNICEEKGID